MISSVVSAVVLTQSGAASASTANFAHWIDYDTTNRPVKVVVGDFNGDGDPDVATAGSFVSVNLGSTGGTLGPPALYGPDGDLQSIAIGDFDADGNPDLVVTDTNDDTVSVLLGSPDGTFGDPTSFAVDVAPSSVAVGDFNDDGDPDLAVSTVGVNAVSILLGGPGGTFGPKTSIAVGDSSPLSVAVGDFNGDSDPDLAVGDVAGNVNVLLGGPAGTFDLAATYWIGSTQDVGSMKIAVGDFNGDPDPDLVVVDKGHAVWTLLGASGGTFTTPLGYFLPHAADVAVADVNGDSHADVVISEDLGQVDVLHGSGNGTFVNLKQFPTGDPSAGVAVGDFDADHRTDVVVTKPQGGEGNGGIAVLLNDPDATPPDTTITGGPSGLTNQNTPTFTFASSEAGSTFECRVDATAFNACSSPRTTPALADGTHTFEARAIDGSNNVDPTPASRTFTVDTVAPDTTITGGPDGPTNDNTPTFEFTSSEAGSTFECGVNGGFTPCTSPYTTAGLGDGDLTFQVRARDAAGNLDATPASRSFTIDRNPPTTSITSGPSGATGDSTPTFGFTSPESDVTFECRVDDAAFEACTTPHTTAQLDDGEHVFYVRAIDSVGNVDPIPAAGAFTVDTVAPDTTIRSGPTGVTSDNTPTFGWEYTDDVLAHECRVDDDPFAACESPETTDALSDGQHTFELRAIDGAGNIDPTPASRTFTVDTVPPDTSITAGPTGTIDDPTPTFGFSSSEAGATLECSVDGAAFGPCQSPYTTGLLGNGSHTFEARATDAAGNTDPTPATRTFTVNLDTVAPNTRIDSGPAALTNAVNATFTFSADEPATFECKLDAGAFAPCGSGVAFGPLGAGGHTLAVRATDPAGNVDATPATWAWTIDTTPPQTTITGGPSSLSLSTRATFAFTSSEGGSGFQCRLDAGVWQTCQGPRAYAGLHSGQHTFAVRAIDRAGNTDPTPAERCWFTLGLL
ncbi:MAG TPA: FG-GAP-like repeat-containing protein [Marmoricola sp.]|nr:FG-GAP-like repeat-containing protein [Marmoricola sp.]